MANIIIFDFEVFSHDTLLGCIIKNNDKEDLWQSWNLNEIKKFYEEHKFDIWVGYNNLGYDNLILEGIVNGKNEEQIKELNELIIRQGIRPRCKLQLYSFDVMQAYYHRISLKVTEAIIGKSIETTEVDFNLPRKLTDEEKRKTEHYNKCDLEQTLYCFKDTRYVFELRLNIIKEFGLDLSCLSITGTQIAAKALKSKRVQGIEFMKIPTEFPKTLQLENEDLRKYYLEEKFRTNEKLTIKVGNADIQCGAGGIHSAIRKYHTDRFLYFDVSGYYNLIMINYDLLPRTMNDESKKQYEQMYHDQLALKGVDDAKRGVYKTILLSVFGSMMNEYTDFYDPYKGSLVTITGQLFLVDLCEKLKDLCLIIQTNTDGLMVEPYNWDDKDKIIQIVKDWMDRTGFVIKIKEYSNLWQRDVNCYVFIDDEKTIKYKGNRFHDVNIEAMAGATMPHIIDEMISNKLLYNTSFDEIINKYLKTNLDFFQFICKKMSFDYLTYDLYDETDKLISSDTVQPVVRVFPNKYHSIKGVITKHKMSGHTHKTSKIANIPNNVFVFNRQIKGNEEQILELLDIDTYKDLANNVLKEFIQVQTIKDINE